MKTLEKQKVVIIGGSQGIGLETAKEAIAKGADVTIASRSMDKLERAEEYLEGKVSTYQLDGSIEEDVKSFFDTFDKIDHLVVSSSGGYGGSIKELDMKAAKELFDSKLWVQMHAVKHASPKMDKGGSIVLFSGIVSKKAMAGQMPYTGVGGAVESLGKMLALELAPIRVNVITPGFIHTSAWDTFMPAAQQEEFFKGFSETIPVKKIGVAKDVTKGVLFFLESDYVTGAVLDIDGGQKLV
ncbi:SDR family oxidoreductase [Flagellimonas lutimaris]|uniref:SDR family oxidoreductase n=1 Tax=Flagellimonas lutimaris TaxID=475082 RepID=A0A3A1NE08_9FLAO|nr:SDR family oxidoreductase [Allomuricauda lutimaris]RIV36683.1 SDR family oxidoreductase [Allomuricauda lutimaris]